MIIVIIMIMINTCVSCPNILDFTRVSSTHLYQESSTVQGDSRWRTGNCSKLNGFSLGCFTMENGCFMHGYPSRIGIWMTIQIICLMVGYHFPSVVPSVDGQNLIFDDDIPVCVRWVPFFPVKSIDLCIPNLL